MMSETIVRQTILSYLYFFIIIAYEQYMEYIADNVADRVLHYSI